MNKTFFYFIFIIHFLFFSCSRQKIENEIKVVTSTTHIGTIVKEIGKDKVKVITIIPGGMCPGHFDIKPSVAKDISDANLVLMHYWESWFKNFSDKINHENTHVNILSTKGNWMIPEINQTAAQEILSILYSIDNANKDFYQNNFNLYQNKISKLKNYLAKYKSKFKNVKVASSMQIKDFLEYLGFNVVAQYSRAEDLNIKEIKKIIDILTKENVKLVVDNLQSGANAGLQISNDLKIKHVVISNFPLNNSYFNTFIKNIQSIFNALSSVSTS